MLATLLATIAAAPAAAAPAPASAPAASAAAPASVSAAPAASAAPATPAAAGAAEPLGEPLEEAPPASAAAEPDVAASSSSRAPTLSLSGQTLTWTKLGSGTYTLRSRSAGETATRTTVSGTSYTPPAHPGSTVLYRVEASIGKWSNAISITYPAKEAQPPPGMLMGVNAQGEQYDYTGVQMLHAKLVRVNFAPSEVGASWFIQAARHYQEVGARIQPVATFDGRMLTPAEVQDLVALDRVPGVEDVELGNETSYGYQYGDGYTSKSYKERARVYAVRVKEAAEALNPHGIGVLAQAEDGGSGSPVWVQEMFASVPGLSRYVAGWTIHPYTNQTSPSQTDTRGIPKMERMVADLAAEGDTTTPIDVTEWGVASDGGVKLSDGTSMSFTETAAIAEQTIPKLIAAAGRHPVASFIVYQLRDQAQPGTTSDREDFYGVLTRNDGPKGAYTKAIEKLMRE